MKKFKPIMYGFLVISFLAFIFLSKAEKSEQSPLHGDLSEESLLQEGAKLDLTLHSKSLNMDRRVQVYLPEGYDEKRESGYPVIYFLHGAGQNSYGEGQLFSIFNRMINQRAILPVIIVKPDGSCPPWGASYFTNSELYGKFEDYIVYDVVGFIDSAFHTIDSRDKRAIMGWSMGAYGAMKSALKHPDIYCGVVAHAGMLNLRMVSQFFPGILSENGGTPVSGYHPDAGFWTLGSFRMTGAFSPNPANPPYLVDYPLDPMGNWIESIWDRWSMNSCPALARSLTPEDDLAIYFDCGLEDETLSYLFNSSFADSLDLLGLPYEFRSFHGDHNATGRYPIGLTYLDSVMNRKGVVN